MIIINGSDNDLDKAYLESLNINLRVQGDENRIKIGKNCTINNLTIDIEDGDENIIEIGDNCTLVNTYIKIYGDSNKFILGNNIKITMNFNIDFGYAWHNYANNSIFSIGNDTTINGLKAVILEPDSLLTIGEDCMFSSGIQIWVSDTHSIIDLEGKLLNFGGQVQFGNHVWVGTDVKIGKRVTVSDNSIVGWNSVVTSEFNEPNVVIAGNPAKIVKQGVSWDRRSPENYKQAQKLNDRKFRTN